MSVDVALMSSFACSAYYAIYLYSKLLLNFLLHCRNEQNKIMFPLTKMQYDKRNQTYFIAIRNNEHTKHDLLLTK